MRGRRKDSSIRKYRLIYQSGIFLPLAPHAFVCHLQGGLGGRCRALAVLQRVLLRQVWQGALPDAPRTRGGGWRRPRTGNRIPRDSIRLLGSPPRNRIPRASVRLLGSMTARLLGMRQNQYRQLILQTRQGDISPFSPAHARVCCSEKGKGKMKPKLSGERQ